MTKSEIISDDAAGNAEAAARRLLGVGWDKLFQWIVVGYACAWFWLGMLEGGPGPVQWGIDRAEQVGLHPPQWLLDTPDWLQAQAGWLAWALPALTAILATAYVRVRRGTGLVTLAIASALISVQVSGSLSPVLWAALLAALPAGLALLIAARQRAISSREEPNRHYVADLVLIDFAVGALAFAWLPVVAPALAVAALVGAYGKDVTEDPCETMAQNGAMRLRAEGDSMASTNAAHVMEVLSAVLLADSAEHRRRLARRLQWVFSGPSGALPIGRDHFDGVV